ncbi:hypothetical protein N0V90_008652 [Kalmusia sp. IMI 367209]|nr:hypothetical protein N0V90_008652 [Kalmusia sp. IMI 367209]
MSILQLPIELFRQIIDEVAFPYGSNSRKGPGRIQSPDIINLVLAHSAFANEISTLLEESNFLAEDDEHLPPGFFQHPNKTLFLARFVLTRPYEYREDNKVLFPCLINNIIDRIMELERPLADVEKHRARFVTVLCRNVKEECLTWKRTVAKRPFTDHLLVAAVYLGKFGLVNRLMLQKSDPLDIHSEYWGHLINAAIQIENLSLIKCLIQLETKQKSNDRDASFQQNTDRTSKAFDVVNLLLEQTRKHERVVEWRHGISLCLAIELDRFDVANKLINTYYGHIRRSVQEEPLFKALCMADDKGLRGLVRLILRKERYFYHASWNGRKHELASKRDKLIHVACKEGLETVLSCLLEPHFESEISKGFDYVVTATIAGRIGIIHVLWDTNFLSEILPLEIEESLKILTEAAPRPQSTEIVFFLLEYKVIKLSRLHPVRSEANFQLVHCITGAAQRGNIGFLKAVAHYGIPLDDEEYYAYVDCPLPIIAAKAFRQTDTVETLLSLGVTDADPMKSMLADQFENGHYPTDAPPFDGIGPVEVEVWRSQGIQSASRLPRPILNDSVEEEDYDW